MILPENVTAAKDRHGRIRYRFRKLGLPSRYLPDPSSPDFENAYRDCFDASTKVTKRRIRSPILRRLYRPNPIKALKGRELVYFVSAKGALVKIGTTVNLHARMKKLQTGCPHRLRLLVWIDGGSELEARYHQEFSEYRVQGEWFKRAAPIEDEIKRIKALMVSNA